MMSVAASPLGFHTAAQSHFIYDNFDRVSVFHGTNFMIKGFPYYPENLRNLSHIEDLKRAGFNAVRLGLFWAGAEPVEGEFNQTYYDIMGSIVEDLYSKGIYTFIDVHQDVLSTKYCLYDAFPLWAIDKAEAPTHPFPWPLSWDGTNPCPPERGWGSNYLSEATGRAFESLYLNKNGLRDSFLKFWAHTAEYFKASPILGYEIINEPWAGDIYAHPDLLLPGHAGSKRLQPFYDIAAAAIRKVDANHLIFYEPVTWGMIFNGTVLGTGFTDIPGGSNWVNASVLSYHYYCWWLDTSSEMSKQTCDRLFGPKVIDQVLRDVHQTGGSAMLTEWGQGCADRLSSIDVHNITTFTECVEVMALADKHFMGWTDWYFGEKLSYSEWFDYSENSANPLSATWKLFSRPYARYIAGTPLSMTYNDDSNEFDFCYVPGENSLTVGTEIFVNFNVFFPNGYNITLSSSRAEVKVDEANHLLTLRDRGLADSKFGKDIKSCVHIQSI